MRCEFCKRLAWYRCGHTGVPVCPVHARLEVVASQPGRRLAAVEVDAAVPEDYPRLKELADHFWGDTEVECFERAHDVGDLPALAALVDDEAVGFLSYSVENDALNIVMLNVVPEH